MAFGTNLINILVWTNLELSGFKCLVACTSIAFPISFCSLVSMDLLHLSWPNKSFLREAKLENTMICQILFCDRRDYVKLNSEPLCICDFTFLLGGFQQSDTWSLFHICLLSRLLSLLFLFGKEKKNSSMVSSAAANIKVSYQLDRAYL